MTASQLSALRDGPCRVEGNSRSFDRDGRPVPDRGSPVHLCRWKDDE
jgi:hypothetical protein